jgi:hypothetical protein
MVSAKRIRMASDEIKAGLARRGPRAVADARQR